MGHIPRACRRQGHGPTTTIRRRAWWAPWRKHQITACWVCHTPLDSTEAARANEQWRDTFASPLAQRVYRQLDH